jgi:hypothetical protein
MGRLVFLQSLTSAFGRWRNTDLRIDPFPLAFPILANTAYLFTAVQFHKMILLLAFLFEKLLAHTTIGTIPGIGHILESRARGDSALRISNSRIVNISTGSAHPFIHDDVSFLVCN